jgi:amino acid transporter
MCISAILAIIGIVLVLTVVPWLIGVICSYIHGTDDWSYFLNNNFNRWLFGVYVYCIILTISGALAVLYMLYTVLSVYFCQ